MRKITLAAWFLAALVSIAAIAGENSGSARVSISFDYNEQNTMAANQFALWVTDEGNKLVKNLLITNFTGRRRGWEIRENSLPLWVQSADADSLPQETLDAISRATPATGKITAAWDCRDQEGKPVKPGIYTIFLEGSARDETQIVFRASIKVGGGAQEERPEPEYNGRQAHREAINPMLANVIVSYTE